MIKKFKQSLILVFCSFFLYAHSFAGEGMWLPLFLKSLNEAEMQSMGMKISAEDIYSINQGSLKDAIVHFGGFCTAEVISSEGLLLTNHHCGYGQIQSHSSLENNLLKNGYWAKNNEEELANPGLFATFIDEIIEVTDIILEGVSDDMTVQQRQSIIDKNTSTYLTGFERTPFNDKYVRPFFHGNQYFAFVTTTYRDVRLVGTPPESIGKFGADTDNWEWPRHTGDFSLFRIYAGPNNEPAEYAEENRPYNPKHALPISLDGVSEGDFTMVFGFPGRTNQYLPSEAVNILVEKQNPSRISIRETALAIVDKYMRKDEQIRLQYASKFARIANYWKKWIGESSGLERTAALEKKKKFESDFVSASMNKSSTLGLANKYLLKTINKAYAQNSDLTVARDYYSELTSRNIELFRVASYMNRLAERYDNNGEEAYNEYLGRLANFFKNFYKNYNPEIDQEVFAALTAKASSELDGKYLPESLRKESLFMRGMDYKEKAEKIYSETALSTEESLMELLQGDAAMAVEKINADPLVKLGKEWKSAYDENVAALYNQNKAVIDSLQRLYMKAIIEVFPDRRFYPDANGTMRVTYGQVNGYHPKDAVCYTPVSYLDGVIEKYKPGDYEFDVSDKLLELYESKDYGQYADETGKVPVCFLGSNHTTGGNSGSPAIDAYGNLIGLNFDRVWEGTMSDINYDKSICRNIMVDARYMLFIIDKFAGASHLIEEMNLVHPKG